MMHQSSYYLVRHDIGTALIAVTFLYSLIGSIFERHIKTEDRLSFAIASTLKYEGLEDALVNISGVSIRDVDMLPKGGIYEPISSYL
jgi:hypothetical protein